jgi:hypothetical protein
MSNPGLFLWGEPGLTTIGSLSSELHVTQSSLLKTIRCLGLGLFLLELEQPSEQVHCVTDYDAQILRKLLTH